MTRETKIGLLIGLAIIVLVAVVVSDYVAVQQRDPAANLLDDPATTASPADRVAVATPMARQTPTDAQPQRVAQGPIPTPQEVDRALRESRAAEAMARRAAAELERAAPRDAGAEMADAVRRDGFAGVIDQTTFERVASVPLLSTVETLEPRDTPVIRTPEELSGQAQTTATVFEPAARRVTAPAEPAAIDDVIVHRVQAGESLFVIARRYLNDGNAWPRIAKANPDVVSPRGDVVEGARLVIPSLRGGTPTNAARDAAQPAARPRTVTVQDGDSLARIARRHLGSPDRWRDLLEANRDVISRPEHIRPGQTLVLPSNDQPAAVATPAPSTPRVNDAAAFGGVRTVTVKDGDTLSSIAYDTLGSSTRWPELFEANRRVLASPDAVRPGQTLRLP